MAQRPLLHMLLCFLMHEGFVHVLIQHYKNVFKILIYADFVFVDVYNTVVQVGFFPIYF